MNYNSMRFIDSVTKQPRNVWLDGDCKIPHAQPITCDVDGMWPPIFLEEHGNDYDVLLYDDDSRILTISELRRSNRAGFWWRT
jgi:hypothetical protein